MLLICLMGCSTTPTYDSNDPYDPLNKDKFEDYTPWWVTNNATSNQVSITNLNVRRLTTNELNCIPNIEYGFTTNGLVIFTF